MSVDYHDLRTFLELVKKENEYVEIHDADWNLEIGALTEATSEYVNDPPLLMFDNIKGYPEGFRVASLTVGSRKRAALSMGLPVDKTKLELVRLLTKKIQEAKPIPPQEVKTGPVMENIMGPGGENEIDIFRFPSLHSHLHDGGRYIGTGDSLINQDPDTGYINVGTYRMQVHESGLLGLWMSPGQQGRRICQKYWDQGKACPVVAVFGGDPLVFQASCIKFPWGTSELDYMGGLRGSPLEIIKGPLTGLPIPAYSEVVIEGEVPPPSEEAREEGPFGEWPGYYSGGTRGTGEPQPVIRIKAIYYRNNPVLMNQAPQWPGAPTHGVAQRSGLLWDQMEAAGIPNIKGVYFHTAYLIVVAITQLHAGHAKMAGMCALNCIGGARNGRYVVVVDDDIDPTNLQEVVWAMQTRVDPATDIQLIDGCWSTPLDPRMPPDKRASGDHTNSRAIFYAVRPWAWRDEFPMVNRAGRERMIEVMNKYRGVIPFPSI
jgi:4-hydroxy-3-polyprenylbenzoate decarboxylase